MENTSRKRAHSPSTDRTNDRGRASPNTPGFALQTQGLPPHDGTPTSLSTREVSVVVSDRTVAPLAFALPDFMNPRPLSGHLLQAVVERTDDECEELANRAEEVVSAMGLSWYRHSTVLTGARCESLCRHFCGDRATVLITKESGRTDFIVLPPVDTALLHQLAGLLDRDDSPVVAAKLLCAAMLALRDTPERAADLLKLYGQLVLRSPQVQLPVPPTSLNRLNGLIDAVQAHAPACLLADEVNALKRHFEVAAQAMDVDSDDLPAQAARDAANAAYEQLEPFLPVIGIGSGGLYVKKPEADAVDQHGTLDPESLMAYLELAVKAPDFIHPGSLNAFIGYGKDHPDSPFTPEAIRSLWIQLLEANPKQIDAATAYWLATVDVDVQVNVDAEVELTGLIRSLPSRAELQTLFRSDESGDEAAVQRIHRIAAQLGETGGKLLKLVGSLDDPATDTLGQAIQHFSGLVAHMVHRASYERMLARGERPAFGDIDAMIPRPEQSILLSEEDQRALLEAAMLLLPFDQSMALARKLLVSQLDDTQRKELGAQYGALELDARNVPLGKILQCLREPVGGAAPDIALLLSSLARSRRKLTDDECKQLAELAAALAVPKPGERLTNCLTGFFNQVGELLLRQGATTRQVYGLFDPLERGLMLRVAPEALASMQPEEQHTAQVMLSACIAGRALLEPDALVASSEDVHLGCLHGTGNFQLLGPDYRVSRGYYHVCVRDYILMLDAERGLSPVLPGWYLTSAYLGIVWEWLELDPTRGGTLPPLTLAESRYLFDVYKPPGLSLVTFPDSHEASRGRAWLRAWVAAVEKEQATRRL